eukprot:TRINITY_DN3798_c0_g1_i4.p1 TRINITY_DN3798_c0_g1~~TRINITY_DN3798_c0_g1_i4.p1  ORF type:complete len:1615 (+),score=530.73 TRINITY_DN3798_c0_g1_i4:178-5022(+)
MTTNEEQNEEIEVLKAIFSEDFREEQGAHWNNTPTFQIRIVPHSDGELFSAGPAGLGSEHSHNKRKKKHSNSNSNSLNYCGVVLHVQFTKDYPKTPPVLSVEKLRGLSSEQLKEISILVNQIVKERVGNVMVYDVATGIQEFLLNHNKKPLSFYDQMVQKKGDDHTHLNPSKKFLFVTEEGVERGLIDPKELERQKKEDEEKNHLNDLINVEIERQRELNTALGGSEFNIEEEMEEGEEDLEENSLLESGEFSSSLQLSLPSSPSSPSLRNQISSSLVLVPSSASGPSIKWKKRSDLGRGSMGETFAGTNLTTGKNMVIKEIKIDSSKKFAKEKSQSLSNFIDQLKKLKHPNLVSYLGSDLEEDLENEILTLRIFSEYITGGEIKVLMKNNRALDERLLKKYSKQILGALRIIHNSGYYHGDLRLSNIMLDGIGADAKLTDYAILKALEEIQNPDKPPNFNLAKEQKEDVLEFGKCLIALSGGKNALPDFMSKMAKDFLEVCLRTNHEERPKVSELLLHPFVADVSTTIHDHIPMTPPPTPPHSSAGIDRTMGEDRTDATASTNQHEGLFESSDSFGFTAARPTTSRYRSDFEEIAELGSGGFGVVVKAKNKLDERYYAIKKVRLNAKDQSLSKMVREVTTLSRLNHQYVVRYYQAWMEGNDDDWNGLSDDEEEEEDWFSSRSGFRNSTAGTRSKRTANRFSILNDGEGNSSVVFESEDGQQLSDVEEDDFDSDEEEEETLTSSVASPKGGKRIILYIQMEYCTKHTLRQLIDDGILDDEERWRLLRQMVEGLNHIHSQGIIHRDLKPSNIFLDQNGDVKIGDFGLATTEHNKVSLKASMEFPIAKQNNTLGREERDITSGVGTPFYSSPEQEKSGTYDQKVDIYSLGIIFFEMCHPFRTGMERVMTLNSLRNNGKYPANFEKEHGSEKECIAWLLNIDPSARPTTHELLESNILPSKMEEEILKAALHSITNPGTTLYSTIVEKLFSVQPDKHSDHNYDYHLGANFEALTCSLREKIVEIIVQVCKNHGAINVQTPLLIPKNNLLHQSNLATLMDDTGILLSLSYDLTLSFARFVARNRITNLRRYYHSRVFRKHGIGKPKELHEFDFDIVSPHGSSIVASMANDAEVIKTVVQMLEKLDDVYGIGNCSIRINHIKLFDAILELCEVEMDKMQAVRSAMVIQKQPWSQMCTKLVSKGIITKSSASALDFYFTTVSQLSDIQSAMTALDQVMKKSRAGKDALLELRYLIRHLNTFGVGKVKLDLGFIFNYTYYSGVVFQAILEHHDASGGIVAAGGRYDKLLLEFCPPGAPPYVNAVGVNVAIEKLVSCVIGAKKGKQKLSTTDTSVFIFSVGRNMLEERMQIASELWSLDIACEYNHNDNMTLEELQIHCKTNGVPWIIILRDAKGVNLVRVRCVESRSEIVVSRIELGTVILYAIAHNELVQPSSIEPPSTPPIQQSNTSLTKSKETLNPSPLKPEPTTPNKTITPKPAPPPEPGSNLEVLFVSPIEEKASKNKRKFQQLAKSRIAPYLNSKMMDNIKVGMVDLPIGVIKDVIITWDHKAELASGNAILQRNPRFKDRLVPLLAFLGKNMKGQTFVALYSTTADDFEILIQK